MLSKLFRAESGVCFQIVILKCFQNVLPNVLSNVLSRIGVFFELNRGAFKSASKRAFKNRGVLSSSVFFKQEKLLKNGFLSNFRREAAKSLSNFLSNSLKKNPDF